jgi:hypothetical protein
LIGFDFAELILLLIELWKFNFILSLVGQIYDLLACCLKSLKEKLEWVNCIPIVHKHISCKQTSARDWNSNSHSYETTKTIN